MAKRKLNAYLMLRLMIVQVWMVICYFPLLFLPFRLHFPFFYRIAAKFFLLANKVRLHNMNGESFDKNGAVIFASNHKCFADPVFIARFLQKPFSFTMSSHVLDIFPPFRIIAFKMRFIGINKKSYTAILKSFEKIKRSIQKKISLIYFPEGYYTLDKPVGEIKGGIAKIAKITGSPIVPVAIYGINQEFIFEDTLKWKDVYIKSGKPMLFNEYADERQFVAALAQNIEKLYYEIEETLATIQENF